MPSPNQPEFPEVDDLLTVKEPTGTDHVRLRTLAQTSSVVRRRQVARRVAAIAAMAGCYLAGILSAAGWIGLSGLSGDRDGGRESASDERPGKLAPPIRKPTGPRPKRDDRPLVAQADYEQIRRVSDRFLYEDGDITTALHYGSCAVNRATREQRAIDVKKDSFLVMALKLERMEESQND
ncbi:MAG: hypothetical protein ACYTG0_09455 [Planctomycetota bacterium]